MNIEIKKSKNPIKYDEAIRFMEKKLLDVHEGKSKELFWTLKHDDIYTAGTSYKKSEILNKKIELIETNRGGIIFIPNTYIFFIRKCMNFIIL